MLHEISPHMFDVEMAFSSPRTGDFALLFREDGPGRCEVMASIGPDGSIELPTCGDFDGSASPVYLFAIDERPFFLVDASESEPCAAAGRVRGGQSSPGRSMGFVPVRELVARNGDPQAFAVVTGMHLRCWYRDNRHCGRCGGDMLPSPRERALVCSCCGHAVYPRISPAVIVAVTDGDRLLLTRYALGDYRKRALVAGFVEVGETPEEAVAREVWEECGVRVKDVRYFASQPWGLSGSLMLGFFAKLDGSPDISLRDGELDWAGWIPRDELDESDDYALGHAMIDAFRSNFAPM